MYHIFLNHYSLSGHLDCFYLLILVNKAALNASVQVSLLVLAFSSFIHTQKWDWGSYDYSIYLFICLFIHTYIHTYTHTRILFNIWGAIILFSIVVAPLWNSPKSV
jgi:hypothetical protein